MSRLGARSPSQQNRTKAQRNTRVADPEDFDEAPPWEPNVKKSNKRMADAVPKLAPVTKKPVRHQPDDDRAFTIDQSRKRRVPDPVEEEPRRPVRKTAKAAPAARLPSPKKEAPLPTIRDDGAVDPHTMSALQKQFGDRAERILEMLEDDEQTDGAISLLSRSIIQTLVRTLPLAETHVRNSQGTKGIYQLNQLVSGIRESLVDLQALREKGDLGRTIVERYIRPSYMEIGVQVTQMFTLVESNAKGRMSREDFVSFRQNLEDTKLNLARYMMAQYEEVAEGVASSLT